MVLNKNVLVYKMDRFYIFLGTLDSKDKAYFILTEAMQSLGTFDEITKAFGSHDAFLFYRLLLLQSYKRAILECRDKVPEQLHVMHQAVINQGTTAELMKMAQKLETNKDTTPSGVYTGYSSF